MSASVMVAVGRKLPHQPDFVVEADPSLDFADILHSLRNGEIEPLCEFSEADYDAMEEERIGEYEARAL